MARERAGPGDIGSPRIYDPSVPHLLTQKRHVEWVIYRLVQRHLPLPGGGGGLGGVVGRGLLYKVEAKRGRWWGWGDRGLGWKGNTCLGDLG